MYVVLLLVSMFLQQKALKTPSADSDLDIANLDPETKTPQPGWPACVLESQLPPTMSTAKKIHPNSASLTFSRL